MDFVTSFLPFSFPPLLLLLFFFAYLLHLKLQCLYNKKNINLKIFLQLSVRVLQRRNRTNTMNRQDVYVGEDIYFKELARELRRLTRPKTCRVSS